jgi:oligoribonuclease NrnB/cAMP/cGMP phosphodiesterase (DHH superfamily)
MRLVTRADFDGICCGSLLKDLQVIDEIFFTFPKDLQDGKIPVTNNDVLANVPFVEGCGMWFDHHLSERERLQLEGRYKGRSEIAKSAARVIFNYYYFLGKLNRFEEMLRFVDKVDSANLSEEEILNPEGWVLLGFICDPRTGMSHVKGLKLSYAEFMTDMVEHIRTFSIKEILELDDVKERTEKYFEFNQIFKDFLLAHSRINGPVVLTDNRGVNDIPPGNRFLVYSLFPEANISVRLMDAHEGKVLISVGYSITNRTSDVNVGSLMLKYGGGGHKAVGTCQVQLDEADRVTEEIIDAIKSTP